MGKGIANRQYSIDYLKALCAVFVILTHSISRVSTDYGCVIPEWLTILTSPIKVHVSLFFLIGGFLSHPQPLKEYYRKKVCRIIVPFYFFNILKILFTNLVSDQFAHASTLSGQLYNAFVLGGLCWFPYTIFLIYCVAPLLWKKEGKSPVACLVAFPILIIINVINSFFGFLNNIIIFQINSVVIYIPFFILGLILQNYKDCLSVIKSNKVKSVLSASSIYILLYSLSRTYSVFSTYVFWFIRLVAVMIVLFCIVEGFRENTIVEKVSNYSYQLMLIDSFFRVAILTIIDKVFSVSIYWIVPQTIMSVVFGVLTCMFVSKTRILKFLFGLQ